MLYDFTVNLRLSKEELEFLIEFVDKASDEIPFCTEHNHPKNALVDLYLALWDANFRQAKAEPK